MSNSDDLVVPWSQGVNVDIPGGSWGPVSGSAIGILIDSQSRLEVRVFTSFEFIPTNVKGSILLPTGRISVFEVLLDAPVAGTEQITYISVPSGMLISLVVSTSNSQVSSGQCYVRVGVQRLAGTPSLPSMVFLSGYLIRYGPLSFPTFISGSADALPVARSIDEQVSPAVGENWVKVQTRVSVRRYLFVRCKLVTGAAVADRLVMFSFNDGVNQIIELPSAVVQAASLTREYVWSVSGQALIVPSGWVTMSLPEFGHSSVIGLRLDVTNIQVADQLSAIYVCSDRGVR